jgi:hypothetical protein
MTVLEIAQRHVTLRKASGSRYAGPCPKCGGSDSTDRFSVYADKANFHCFSCGFNGDAITLLREMDGLSCPDAHAALGKDCDSTNCGAKDKCRFGDRQPNPVRRDPLLATPVLPKEPTDHWSPAAATSPAEQWTEKAEKLVAWAHANLLEHPEQLQTLAARGIPREAVLEYRLGWNPGEKGQNAIYRERAAWGLPPKIVDGKAKKLWIPRGLVIPSYRDGHLQKIRIRRPEEDRDKITISYCALEGGGDDVPVFGANERALVVVEADLCGIAVAWACRGIAGAIPLASCSVKPKTNAAAALQKALCILVATDYDPGTDKQGKHKNPGGNAAAWWPKHYPRAERWPVPLGKDPGDYLKDHGGDLRAWVQAGLHQYCPALTLAEPVGNGNVAVTNYQPEPPADPFAASGKGILPTHHKGTSAAGSHYVIAHQAEHVAQLTEHYPGIAIFAPAEIEALRGMTREEAEKAIQIKNAFGPGAEITGTKSLLDLPPEPQGKNWYDRGETKQQARRA